MEPTGQADPAFATTRVVVANLTGVLGQRVCRSIGQAPDMVLVGQSTGNLDMLLTITPDTDVLLMGAPDPDLLPGICSHLLNEFPFLKILVLAETGDTATLYWLGLRREPLTMVSTAAVLGVIRHARRLNPLA